MSSTKIPKPSNFIAKPPCFTCTNVYYLEIFVKSFPHFLQNLLVSVFIFLSCFRRPFGDEIRLCNCISISVMLILFPKLEFQYFIFFCHVRMFIQIVAKIQFIIISCVSKMNVINLICKALFCISLIERDSVCLGGHFDKTIQLQDVRYFLHVGGFRNFYHHINDTLGPYSLNSGTSDMTNPDNRLIR